MNRLELPPKLDPWGKVVAGFAELGQQSCWCDTITDHKSKSFWERAPYGCCLGTDPARARL